jgi:predicted protein tyrosine phosphatase
MWAESDDSDYEVERGFEYPYSVIATSSMPCEILRNKLWIGDEFAAREPFLEKYPMDVIVSLGSSSKSYSDYECSHITYHRIVIHDIEMEPIAHHFEEACDFIHKHVTSGGRVLVHCQAGISRSATICIAYLMKYMDLSLRNAYALVRSARPVIEPNPGFMRQLKQFEESLTAPTNTLQ